MCQVIREAELSNKIHHSHSNIPNNRKKEEQTYYYLPYVTLKRAC